MNNFGTLYICPTPIGNLEDITLRAVRILKEVDIIACEDTRTTQKLLNHYEISTRTTSYHKFSEDNKCDFLVKLMREGKNVALVSDAGTPCLSDPGSELLKAAFDSNIRVVPLPGASSITTTLSCGLLNQEGFVFVGFLPKSFKEKEDIFQKYAEINLMAFESPNRLMQTLEDIEKILGNRTIILARELTKVYEEVKKATVKELYDYYSCHVLKGEICFVIEGVKTAKTQDIKDIESKIKILKKEGYSTKEISKILSLLTDLPKKEIYSIALQGE